MWADDARERVRRAGRVKGAGLAVPVPLELAAAVIENITAYEDLVSVRLYGYPWILEGSFPMIAPCFRVIAIDDTGVKHDGVPDSSSYSPAHDGTGSFWFWPPVPAYAGKTAPRDSQHPLGSSLGAHRHPRPLIRPASSGEPKGPARP